ncbi:hypothetical protein SAMN02927924_03775 [Sphingobium faniae]|nr:hypothetical protein SAMN02927924_03775 [Sphingobium faniae]
MHSSVCRSVQDRLLNRITISFMSLRVNTFLAGNRDWPQCF